MHDIIFNVKIILLNQSFRRPAEHSKKAMYIASSSTALRFKTTGDGHTTWCSTLPEFQIQIQRAMWLCFYIHRKRLKGFRKFIEMFSIKPVLYEIKGITKNKVY